MSTEKEGLLETGGFTTEELDSLPLTDEHMHYLLGRRGEVGVRTPAENLGGGNFASHDGSE